MQGTILVLDGVSTNRIMLKVQLSSAWYHVVQSDGLAGLGALVRRTRPDLIITAMDLPDGTAIDLHSLLADKNGISSIPIIAISAQNDLKARLAALSAGINEVLSHPIDDMLLQARIRSLIRSTSIDEELHLQGATSQVAGLAEAAAAFSMPGKSAAIVPQQTNVALVTNSAQTCTLWRTRLQSVVPYTLSCHQINKVHALMDQSEPDAIVLELAGKGDGASLRLLADLRARGATRNAAIIAVPNPANPSLAAEALDRGAHDVLQGGFCAEELALRIKTQLQRKENNDQMRDNVRNGLRAALRDPMTGLFNRRHAMPWLSRVARQSGETGESFAVMLADLDHFKAVNDQFGHPAGDAVLVETARRLSEGLRPDDMIARIGGEEFMIVLPNTGQTDAMAAAARMCRQINSTPFIIPGISKLAKVTISIGVAVSPPPARPSRRAVSTDRKINEFSEHITDMMIGQADQALYRAKDAGRNQFTVTRPAA